MERTSLLIGIGRNGSDKDLVLETLITISISDKDR
jgi:hypothetical protein